jgi:hypothetical protein
MMSMSSSSYVTLMFFLFNFISIKLEIVIPFCRFERPERGRCYGAHGDSNFKYDWLFRTVLIGAKDDKESLEFKL